MSGSEGEDFLNVEDSVTNLEPNSPIKVESDLDIDDTNINMIDDDNDESSPVKEELELEKEETEVKKEEHCCDHDHHDHHDHHEHHDHHHHGTTRKHKPCCNDCSQEHKKKGGRACICEIPFLQRRGFLGEEGCGPCGCHGCSDEDIEYKLSHEKRIKAATKAQEEGREELSILKNGCCKECMKAFSESGKACICQVPIDVRMAILPYEGCKICKCKGCHPEEILLRTQGKLNPRSNLHPAFQERNPPWFGSSPRFDSAPRHRGSAPAYDPYDPYLRERDLDRYYERRSVGPDRHRYSDRYERLDRYERYREEPPPRRYDPYDDRPRRYEEIPRYLERDEELYERRYIDERRRERPIMREPNAELRASLGFRPGSIDNRDPRLLRELTGLREREPRPEPYWDLPYSPRN